MLAEVCNWEAWGEYHIHEYDVEPPQTEDGVVEQSCFAVGMDALVKRIPTLSKFRVEKPVLILEQKVHYPKRP